MKTRLVNTALPVALLGILGLSWEASVHFFEIPSYILPGPWEIVKVMWQRMDLFAAHGVVTLIEIVFGFLVGPGGGTNPGCSHPRFADN